MKRYLLIASLVVAGGQFITASAQDKPKPSDTEFYTPVPAVVSPGTTNGTAPADAIILFDGKDLNEWVSVKDNGPAKWIVNNGAFTVDKTTGNIETKRKFNNYQLHIEWQIPSNITGEGQARGNSGLFLASTGGGDLGYELQILDSYHNKTYTNGQAGSIYKQAAPMVNANRKPGEWQSYDVIWTAPVFKEDGSLKSAARVTVLFNGVLIQNNFELAGPTLYIGKATYSKPHGASPIKLQSHGDKSEPISFRNIWIREL